MTTRSEVIKSLRRRGVVWKNNSFMFGTRKMSSDEAYGVYRFGSLADLLQEGRRRRIDPGNPHGYIANPYTDCVDCALFGCPRRLKTSLQMRLQVTLDKTKFLTAYSKNLLSGAIRQINTIRFEEMADLLDSVLIQLDLSRSAAMATFTKGKPFDAMLNAYRDEKLHCNNTKEIADTRNEHDENYEAFRIHIDPIMETLKNLHACL